MAVTFDLMYDVSRFYKIEQFIFHININRLWLILMQIIQDTYMYEIKNNKINKVIYIYI